MRGITRRAWVAKPGNGAALRTLSCRGPPVQIGSHAFSVASNLASDDNRTRRFESCKSRTANEVSEHVLLRFKSGPTHFAANKLVSSNCLMSRFEPCKSQPAQGRRPEQERLAPVQIGSHALLAEQHPRQCYRSPNSLTHDITFRISSANDSESCIFRIRISSELPPPLATRTLPRPTSDSVTDLRSWTPLIFDNGIS